MKTYLSLMVLFAIVLLLNSCDLHGPGVLPIKGELNVDLDSYPIEFGIYTK